MKTGAPPSGAVGDERGRHESTARLPACRRNNYANELDRGRLLDNVNVAIASLPALAADIDSLQRYMTADEDSNPDSPPK
jgi:hypothetical protein